jgi:hypothetical protein
MERVVKYEDVAQLGQRLREELATEDFLASWMAEYLAELIHRANESAGEEQFAAKSDAANVILQIWNHRRVLPVRPYPFQGLDGVFAALDHLSEPRSSWKLFNVFGETDPPAEEEMSAMPLLAQACALDTAAYQVIRVAVAAASSSADRRDADWMDLATEIADAEYQSALRKVRRYWRDVLAEDEDDGDDANRDRDPTAVLRDRLDVEIDRLIALLGSMKQGAEEEVAPTTVRD